MQPRFPSWICWPGLFLLACNCSVARGDANSNPVYTPKPAYLAAATLTRLLSGNTYAGRLGLTRGSDYALAFSDGQSTRFVAWTTSTVPQVEILSLAPGTYAMVSRVGDDLGTVTADDNGLTLTLTDAPVYFVPQQAPR